MWLAIIYLCFTGDPIRCDFVTTTVSTRMECLKTVADVTRLLDIDDEVLYYDRKCVELRSS